MKFEVKKGGVINYSYVDDKTVRVPKGITALGPYDLSYHSSVTQIILPDSVQVIQEGAFCGRENLEKITLSHNIDEIPSHCFCDCTKLKEIAIPEGVTNIGADAFADCTSLETVILPQSLRYIEEEAFLNCYHLKLSALPPSLEYIGKDAFYNCLNVTNIPPEYVNICPDIELNGDIPEGAFADNNLVQDLTIHADAIHTGAFQNFSNLQSLTIHAKEIHISVNLPYEYKLTASFFIHPFAAKPRLYHLVLALGIHKFTQKRKHIFHHGTHPFRCYQDTFFCSRIQL